MFSGMVEGGFIRSVAVVLQLKGSGKGRAAAWGGVHSMRKGPVAQRGRAG